MSLLVDHGADIRPWPDGPMVRALPVEAVKAEFFKQYLAKGETERAKQDARRKAFHRAIETANGRGLVAVRELDGIEYAWPARG
jgi:hypothetical protein